MKDDLGVDLAELEKGFGGVNEGYEVGFCGARRSISPRRDGGGGGGGGCCFGGRGGWFEESLKSFEST